MSATLSGERVLSDLEMVQLCAEAMGLRLTSDGLVPSDNVYRIAVKSGECTGYELYDPLHDDEQAMALLCWLVRHNDNERLEISNHVFFYHHRAFNFTQLGGFFRQDHLRRAIVECVSKIQSQVRSRDEATAK